MVISKIQGGLGNQLFCYFCSYSFIKYQNFELLLDIYDYNFYRKDRPFFLDKFNIDYKLADNKQLKKFRHLNISKLDYSIFQKFNISTYKSKKVKNIYLEKNNNHKNLSYHQNNIPDHSYIEGYWQNFKYLNNIKEYIYKKTELKKKFVDFNDNLINEIKKQQSISIHIRRDDLLRKPFSDIYYTCSNDYYLNAINFFKSKFSNPNFYIFTDDIDWVKSKLPTSNKFNIISDLKLNDYSEFYLMKNCKNHIISNSTFSLWSAWLAEENSSFIITPKYWYKIESPKIHPSNWIEMNNI
jgi:hypothetical protein